MTSFIPVLSDVLYYTDTDAYDYLTDNRPIYNIDTNTRAIASAMVGSGYGEHVAINGDILTPGKCVELLSNDQIKYPDGTTVPSTCILGLVIGSTAAGLNRVIWSSGLLETSALGLLSGVLTGATPGQILVSTNNSTGTLSVVSSTTSDSLILGKIKSSSGTVITIGREITGAINTDISPITNSHNLYGLTRVRNLITMLDLGQVPMQYEKDTIYQSSIGTLPSQINLLNAQLPSAIPTISSLGASSITYGSDSLNWKIKEKYSNLEVGGTDSISGSSWPSVSYQTTFSGGIENFDLAQIGSGIDYSEVPNLPTFKEFNISKYYQYAKVSSGPTYGKVTVTATVFDPQGAGIGGESYRIIVWDFFDYDAASGLETKKRRVVTIGSSADNLYTDITIFPSILISA